MYHIFKRTSTQRMEEESVGLPTLFMAGSILIWGTILNGWNPMIETTRWSMDIYSKRVFFLSVVLHSHHPLLIKRGLPESAALTSSLFFRISSELQGISMDAPVMFPAWPAPTRPAGRAWPSWPFRTGGQTWRVWLENHRKIIGKPWENGKIMGKPSENDGLMGFNGETIGKP